MLEAGHMTGLSVRMLTPVRKPGGETRGSFIIRVQLALISVKESAKKAIRVSSLMVFSSVGSTQHGTELSRVRMVPVVKGGSVFFAHTPEQLRLLPQQSPRGNGSSSGDLDYVGSPIRHRFDIVSSPTSILASPPLSPPSDSPPLSPSGSFYSVSELAASMRSMQLGKSKMNGAGACSWGMQMGSGYGSLRGSTLRPGFCRSPSTPTRSGLGQFDLWECNNGFEEEPAMERVESGRDLRARMYAKLSKENSLDGLDPTEPDPDLDWVSELVK